MTTSLRLILVFPVAVVASYALTLFWRRLAVSLQHTARPDLWHSEPTPISGGLGLAVAGLLAQLLLGFSPTAMTLWLSAFAFLALGLWDDLRPLTPKMKLLTQFLVASGIVSLGVVLDISPRWLAVACSVFWIVAVVNAFNLLDNMDGVAAGVAAVVGTATGAAAFLLGRPEVGACAILLGGAALGFLRLNAPPARIFMGDCGSMFLGGFLAVTTLSLSHSLISRSMWMLVAAGLLLYVPLLNLAFITIVRRFEGIPISRGAADHFNYRLLALGISHRRVMYISCVLATLAGGSAIVALSARQPVWPVTVALAFVLTLYIALFLSGADVSEYRKSFVPHEGNGRPSLLRRVPLRAFLYLIDLTLIPAIYYSAYLIRFESGMPAYQWDNFLATFPFLLLYRFLAVRLLGLYYFHWLYAGVNEMIKVLVAVLTSSMMLVTTAAFLQVPGLSRGVVVLDAALGILALGYSRIGLRLLQHFVLTASTENKTRRALILGAGDAGEIMLRECRSNTGLRLWVRGFLDDDERKHGIHIHGVSVQGPLDKVAELVPKLRIDVVIIAIPSLAPARLREIERLCIVNRIPYKIFHIELRDGQHSQAAEPQPPPRHFVAVP